MTQDAKNRVELWIEETSDHGLPVPGLEIEAGRTAVVITDPQNDFLHEDGVAWGVVGESATENNTIANLKNLMETAVSNEVPGIDADCGGGCACATCHVYVDAAWLAQTGEASPMETSMLQLAEGVSDNSRLSCQISVNESLDGLIVRMPESQH